MAIEIKFIPLSFINRDDEILKQIKNTVLFSYLFQNFKETSLNQYLESTQYGYTASASEIGTHQLVRITDINSGKVNWDTVPFCDCDSEGKYLLKDDDILVARTGGTTGKSFIVKSAPKNAIFASYLIRLRLKKDVNLEFITLFLNSYTFWSQIVEMKSGSAMPNVNAEKLKTLVIPKLSLKEQNEFVSAFKNSEKTNGINNIFDKIEEVESLFLNSKEIVNELTHQIDLINQMRQAFLREAMQGKLVKSTNVKETGQQLLEKIKAEKAQLIAEKKLKKEKEIAPISEDDIPFEIPNHWAWCRLGEIAITFTGNSINEREKSIKYSKIREGLDYVGTKDVKFDGKGINYNTGVKIPFNDDKFKTTKENSILMCIEGGSSGKKYALTNKVICFGNKLLTSEINSNLSPFFYYKYYQSQLFSNEYIDKSKGLRGGVSINQFREIIAPLPPLHEQEQIVAKLEELMAFCDGLEQSIKESQGYNEMLLQQVLREALQGRKSNIDF
jgi:type I restriction enzyme, S subunit